MQAYLVCATPRSGSTLLCEMLRDTGLAGRPLEHFEILRHSSSPRQPREYFEDLPRPRVARAARAARAGDPTARRRKPGGRGSSREGTGANGVWGGKLMWGHVDDLVARARELPGLAGADLRATCCTTARRPALVLVTRRDKVAQAVSLWRAVQTQSWRAGEDTSDAHEPRRTTSTASTTSSRQLEADERAWRDWFAAHGGGRSTSPTRSSTRRPRRRRSRGAAASSGCRLAASPSPRLCAPARRASADWVERYRQRARTGGRVTATARPRLTAASAGGRGGAHHPRGGRRARAARCCCSAAARTRSCCCGSPRRRSRPLPLPFPVLHVDTGHNFPEVIEFRDRRRRRAGPQADRRLGAGVDRHRPGQRGRARRRRATGCRP